MHAKTATDVGEVLQVLSAALCPLSFLVFVSYLLGLFVFGPLHARATWTPPRTRFRIADILILIAQLQIAGGLVLVMDGESAVRLVAAFVAWVLVIFWWWAGVRMLAKARIEQGAHRLWFLALAVPAGYSAAVGVLLSPLLAVLGLSTFHQMIIRRDPEEALSLGLLMLMGGAVVGAIAAVRWYCRQIVDTARDDVAREQGIAFGQLDTPSTRRTPAPMATDREVQIIEDDPWPPVG